MSGLIALASLFTLAAVAAYAYGRSGMGWWQLVRDVMVPFVVGAVAICSMFGLTDALVAAVTR
jgi:hypothetical protein